MKENETDKIELANAGNTEAEQTESLTEQQPKEAKVFNWKREIWEWVQAIAVAVIVVFILKQFVFTIVEVKGDSMIPTLHTSDRLVVLSRHITKIENGDIIVFYPEHDKDKPYIKRVIAVAGQTVDIDRNSRIIVDGKRLEENYVSKYEAYRGDMEYPLTVKDGTVFVMGDNRPNSKDSRMSEVGLVTLDSVIGKATLRWYPFQQFKVFEDIQY